MKYSYNLFDIFFRYLVIHKQFNDKTEYKLPEAQLRFFRDFRIPQRNRRELRFSALLRFSLPVTRWVYSVKTTGEFQ